MEDGRWKTEDRGRNNRQCENSSTQENYEKKKTDGDRKWEKKEECLRGTIPMRRPLSAAIESYFAE